MKSLLLALFTVVAVQAATLNSYAIGKLSSAAIATQVRERFKANGEPLFLIHDSKKGVSVGDFIRFSDKMVLIDGQVWQTLAAVKALNNLNDIPVSSQTGSANSSEWYKKSAVVSSENSRKSYVLGAEILKIFEEQFTNLPSKENIIISFSGGVATLIVPDQLINSLKLQRVVKSTKTGEMVWTVPAIERQYKSNSFSWQAWAADPAEPSGSISYQISGSLPAGVRWNSSTHSIEGTPTQAGEFSFTVSARSSNQRISMSGTLVVDQNSAPLWADVPDTLRISEEVQRFPLLLSDFESPARSLKLTIHHIPLGFATNDSLRHLIWTPGDFAKPENDSIVLTVSDPMGKSTRYSVPVDYSRDGVHSGYSFAALTPPWDTLVEGVTYTWNIENEKRHWALNHLKMTLGESNDSAILNDSVIIMKPGHDSLFLLQFQFSAREGDTISYDLNLPVTKNLPPYFTAFPEKWDVEVHNLAYFVPKAIDPEGGAVTIRLRSADSGFVWYDGRLSFAATQTGTYQAYLEAQDVRGNISVQHISYYVKQVYDKYVGFKVESGIWPGRNTWNKDSWGFMHPWRLAWDSRALRFGIFSPDACNMFNPKPFRFPFFYVGTELIPPHKRAEGKSVVIDAGASYNITSRQVQTFGLMVNVEASAYVKQLYNSQIDFRFLFFARHMLRKVAIDLTINDENGKVDYRVLKDFDLLSEFVSTNNVNVFIGATQWFHLGYGMFVGPSFQFRTAPLAMTYKTVSSDTLENGQFNPDSMKAVIDRSKGIYTSFTGVGARYDLKIKRFNVANSVRFGWGGEAYGVMAYWDASIGFGRFTR